MAAADYASVSSALYSCTWASEMPREAQHVNPDVKLTLKAAAVSVLPSRGSRHHTAQALVLSLACLERGNFPIQLLCLPHAVPRIAMLFSLPGWTICSLVLSPEAFESCEDLGLSSSYWRGLSV